MSPPLPAAPGTVRASGPGLGDAVWVLLADGRAEIAPGPGTAWRELPATPQGTTVLAAGPGSSTVQALAVSGATLTVFELTAGTWTKTQAISVPIAYGSSS